MDECKSSKYKREQNKLFCFSPTHEELCNCQQVDKKISRAKCVKYLGILIDENLKWSEHINEVYIKLRKYIGIFYKIRNKLPRRVLRNLYFATVYPQLQYGVELYANTCYSYLKDLIVLSNWLLRILQFKPRICEVADLYVNFDTLKIPELFEYKILQIVHKFFNHNDSLPPSFENYFTLTSTIHEHCTRGNSNVYVDRSRVDYGARCLKALAGKYWNSLPKDIKIVISYNAFKVKLKSPLQL